MFSQVEDVSFASCFDRWLRHHEREATAELGRFIVSNDTSTSAKESVTKALLSCVSVSLVQVDSGFYDHRHMFVVPKRNQPLVDAFIASPYLPADRLAIATRHGYGVCSSGIANSAAANLLRTELGAGSQFPISFLLFLPL